MKAYYFYYQTHEKETWKLGVDTESGRKQAIEEGAKRMSALATDQQITDATDPDKVKYRGPFYIDIDSKDIAQSIESAQSMQRKLVEMEVPERCYEIYCSGSKGFHFYLHQKLFYNGWALANLPAIYKNIAKSLYVYGLDYQVYCGGKGNLLRVPGQRADGRFKERILPDTLMTMTPEKYQEITTGVSQETLAMMPMQAPQAENPYCMSLFQQAQLELKSMNKTPRQAVAAPELIEFKDQPPPCVEDLCDGKTRPNLNFNQLAMQLAVFTVRTGMSFVEKDGYFQRLAKTAESSTYVTPHSRIQHVEGLAKYLDGNAKAQFTCPAMRSVIATSPCSTCSLGSKQVAAAEDENFEIIERTDGYYHISENGTYRRLTSFLVLPYQVIYAEGAPNKENDPFGSRSHILAHVEQGGLRHNIPVSLTEDCWGSRSNFIATFSGISNLACFSSDLDIQRLKYYILKDLDELDEQIGVKTVGIHRTSINKKPWYTWVDSDFSVNKWGMRDTHLYTEPTAHYDQSALPRYLKIDQPDKVRYDYVKLFQSMVNLNEPGVVAPLLGWLSAAALKSHFMGLWTQFPLMMMWGGRGSGKTRTASILAGLHGCDYWTHAPPTLASGTTDFALFSICASTTTVTRVLDEFNRQGMRSGRYEHISEIFKAAFNNSAITKGRLRSAGERGGRGGGIVEHHPITAPLILLGEHAPEVPALLDRMYLVQMREPSIQGRQGYMEYLLQNREQMRELGKAMVMQALHVRDDWVESRMHEWGSSLAEKNYTERQRYTRQVIGTGLDFLDHVMVNVLELPVEDEMAQLREAYLGEMQGQKAIAYQTGYLTEVDRMLTELGTLMAASKSGASAQIISSNVIWLDDRNLYLDPHMAFFYLEQSYVARRRALPVRQSEQFKRLVSAEQYYVRETMVPDRVANRPCMVLSLELMAEKGIDVSLFS